VRIVKKNLGSMESVTVCGAWGIAPVMLVLGLALRPIKGGLGLWGLGLPYLGLGLNPLAVKPSVKIILSDAFAVIMAAE
jgi:hypothetical protein